MVQRRVAVLGVLLALVGAGSWSPAHAGPPAGADKWALLVGVDHFQGKTRPNTGSVGDTEDVHDALVRNGWREDHIRVLTDGAATLAGMRDGLAWLAANSTDRSYSVFHYSGHVKQQGGTVYLWPYDNRWMPDTELAGALGKVRGWAWIDIAGCEAGAFDKGLATSRHLVTGSSQGNEKSYEMPPSYRNSVFVFFLVEEGMASGTADANNDGRVSLQEAFRYAADHAPPMTEGQKHGPQHPYTAGGDGTEWFLDPPPPPPSPAPATPATSQNRCLAFCK